MANDFLPCGKLRGLCAKGCGRQDNQLNTYDYFADIPGNESTTDLVEVQFKNTHKAYFHNSNNLPLQRECAYLLERRLFDTGHLAIVLDAQTLGIESKSQIETFAAIATELTRKGIITICIDLYGEIKVDNAFTIAVDENSTQPVDKNKDYCTVCQQHLAASIEDIINLKL